MRAIPKREHESAIDAAAREQNLDHAARHALRCVDAPPLLDIIKQRVEAARADALPASAMDSPTN